MKSLLEEGSIGVDMPPLPDDIWNGVGLLLLIEEPTFSATSSDTLATWSIPENEPITTTANPCNGIKRWYDPITGRWLSKDPIGISGGLNQYVFCGNDPVNTRDPSGLHDWAWFMPAGERPYIMGSPGRFQLLHLIGMQPGGWLFGSIERYGPGFHQLAHLHDPLSAFLLGEDGLLDLAFPFDFVVEGVTICGTYPVAVAGCALHTGGDVLHGTLSIAGSVTRTGVHAVVGVIDVAGNILGVLNPFSGPSDVNSSEGGGGLLTGPSQYAEK